MNKYNISVDKSEKGSYLPSGTIVHPRYGEGTWSLEFTEHSLDHKIDRKVRLEYNTQRGSGTFIIYPDTFPETEAGFVDLVEYMIDEDLRITDIENSGYE